MKLDVGDRVKFVNNTGITHACTAPLGTIATITDTYSVDGHDFVDVKWSANGHRWLDSALLAERFHRLYETGEGIFTEQPPIDPYDPRNWGLG